MTRNNGEHTPMGNGSEATSPSDREIVVSRRFNAPRELVWEAFTRPEHVAHWWGPEGFSTTTAEMDVRPGGVWRFVMHGPNGVDYQNFVRYTQVVKPERLVYLHGENEDRIHFEVTVTFVEGDGATEVTLRQVYDTKEARDRSVQEFGAIEGARQTLSRLAAHLETM